MAVGVESVVNKQNLGPLGVDVEEPDRWKQDKIRLIDAGERICRALACMPLLSKTLTYDQLDSRYEAFRRIYFPSKKELQGISPIDNMALVAVAAADFLRENGDRYKPSLPDNKTLATGLFRIVVIERIVTPGFLEGNEAVQTADLVLGNLVLGFHPRIVASEKGNVVVFGKLAYLEACNSGLVSRVEDMNICPPQQIDDIHRHMQKIC